MKDISIGVSFAQIWKKIYGAPSETAGEDGCYRRLPPSATVRVFDPRWRTRERWHGYFIGLGSLDQATRALNRLCGCQRINDAQRFISSASGPGVRVFDPGVCVFLIFILNVLILRA